MTLAKQPTVGTDDTMTTGVRDAAPAGTGVPSTTRDAVDLDEMAVHGERRPRESWPPSDEPESESPVPRGTLLAGKYAVERPFAEGGMGIVCLGRHVQLDQQVAIKFLRRSLLGRPLLVQRFLNEARALAALRGEHVVRVMDVGQTEAGRPYLVMEHLDGIHLEALLARDGPLGVETAVRYVLQVCESLSEAHALGIVHRDLKPENLFLWSGGPNADSVKVLDFGLAKQLGTSGTPAITGPQDSLGSPGYMSPEQVVTPQLVDSRTDIWSLGVVLYRLVTNVEPFDGGSMVEVLSHILNAVPVSLPELSPTLDADLDVIVRRCLEKAPEARYQTMSQLADALNAYLGARQGSAAGVATLDALTAKRAKLARPERRARWPGAVGLLVLLLGGATYAADRSGRVRLRDFTDSWLTPARLSADPEALVSQGHYEQFLPFFRGVTALDPLRDASGAMTLRAVLEPEVLSSQPTELQAATPPMTDEERVLRQLAYRRYLEDEGLTPLSDGVEVPSGSPPSLSETPDP